ncbi:unnamed protein product [Symbiodinium sp. KB8]|nr:unnamed protein product [Symbiodinium sp. KB8]
MPPSACAAYARGHDDAMWTMLQNMLGGTGDADAAPARHVAALPGALGGLGLQSAETAAPAAYWVSWADTLPAIHARLPRCAANYVQLLESEAGEGVHCLAEAAHARRMPVACCRTTAGATAPHGGCSSTALAPHHQWHQVPETGRMVCGTTHRGPLPYTLAIANRIPPQAMQMGRLRLPLPLCSRRCGPNPGCGGAMDPYGDHALAYPRTGLLARRAKVVERAWVRVAREAVGAEGQVVPQQWFAHTTATGVPADDRCRLDLVVHGATANGGALCCDARLVSRSDTGTAATPNLQGGGPQKLLVLGSEIEGRWSTAAQCFVRDLVRLRHWTGCSSSPPTKGLAGL